MTIFSKTHVGRKHQKGPIPKSVTPWNPSSILVDCNEIPSPSVSVFKSNLCEHIIRQKLVFLGCNELGESKPGCRCFTLWDPGDSFSLSKNADINWEVVVPKGKKWTCSSLSSCLQAKILHAAAVWGVPSFMTTQQNATYETNLVEQAGSACCCLRSRSRCCFASQSLGWVQEQAPKLSNRLGRLLKS